MKRRYLKPETACIEVKMQQMVCGSIKGTSGAEGLGVNNGGTEGTDITTGNARSGGFWDSDE
jgi:hypothetical protein